MDSMEVDDPPRGGSGQPSGDREGDLLTAPGDEFNIDDMEEIVVPALPPPIISESGDTGRLMITHITNINFKSYAGTQVLGPFHQSFSSIIGPNGSGKSNVIDSMLFVFGFRASKIRSKKISVLIHNSENHQGIDSCTVSVHFQKIIDGAAQDSDGGGGDASRPSYTVIPGSKMCVSRTAHRDNSSYYQVDGKRCTFKQVGELLRRSGIDLQHNRFLILQGEVEQISLMKPKAPSEHEEGMLEYLEDIIGSSRFKEPIARLTTRVEKLNELRSEKLNRVKVVEKEKDNLETGKDEAMEYLRIEDDITRKKNLLCQTHLLFCSRNEAKAASELAKVKAELETMTQAMAAFDAKRKEKSKEQKKIYNTCEKLTQECEDGHLKYTELEKKDCKLRERLKHAKARVHKLEKSVSTDKAKVVDLQMTVDKSGPEREKISGMLGELEKRKTIEDGKLAAAMEDLATATNSLQQKKTPLEQELVGSQAELNEKKAQRDMARHELDIYNSAHTQEVKKLETMEANYETTQVSLKKNKREAERIEKRLPEVRTALTKARRDLESAEKEETASRDKLKGGRTQLETAKSTMSAAAGQGKVMDGLKAQKANGSISGIQDKLVKLGSIDPKYNIAISTACGALENVVVDRVSSAEKCIQYLKGSGLGSTTFICLDKMEHLRHQMNPINTPENVPRLFDLVRTEDQFKPAFYHALRDTLVAESLDQATRIAYGRTRYRVVTLHGQLIDVSGTMRGGGKPASVGKMGSSVSAPGVSQSEIKEMEKKTERDTRAYDEVRARRQSLENSLDQLTKELNELERSQVKVTGELKFLAEQEVMLKKQIQEQKVKVAGTKPDPAKVKLLEKSLKDNSAGYEKVAKTSAQIEEKIKMIQDEIVAKQSSLLKPIQTKINLITKQMDEVSVKITKLEVSVKAAKRNVKKAEDRVESGSGESAETRAQIESIESKELKELEEEATAVTSEYEQTQARLEEMNEELRKVQEELKVLEEDASGEQKKRMEMKYEVEKYEGVVKEMHQKAARWKRDLGKLKLHMAEYAGEEDAAVEPLETIVGEKLEEVDKDAVSYEITLLEDKLKGMKPNMAAIMEYRKKEAQYLERVGELDRVTEARESQRGHHERLRRERLEEFMSGFSVVTLRLKEMYQMITLGGDAELELVDSLDPFSEGIVFSVRPPKKSWKNISNLSGGEKTLSSLALVFALHHYRPTPLYVMDEIDAALDFKNVSIVANYIKDRTKNAQFIIISLRNNMFELADRLIGIFKTDNCTKSIPINPNQLALPVSTVPTTTVATSQAQPNLAVSG